MSAPSTRTSRTSAARSNGIPGPRASSRRSSAPGTASAWPRMPDRPALVGPLTARLALAFLTVAMGALALLGAVVLVVGARDVARLARLQQDEVATVVTDAAAAAYSAAGGWAGADLQTPLALARLGGGEVVVLDASGRVVSDSLP